MDEREERHSSQSQEWEQHIETGVCQTCLSDRLVSSYARFNLVIRGLVTPKPSQETVVIKEFE